MVQDWIEELRLPLPWVIFILGGVFGGAFWIASLQGDVKALQNNGSPASMVTATQVQTLSIRVGALEGRAGQIEVTTARLARMEAQLESIARDIARLEKSTP